MKDNNANRVFKDFVELDWCYKPNDSMRFNRTTNVITDYNTPIALIVDLFDENKNEFNQILVITMQDFKSQPSWKIHKKQLAKAANNWGYEVVFIPEIDIGFGQVNYQTSHKPKGYNEYVDDLIKVAKYSKDDIKTACVAINSIANVDTILSYSYNQFIDGEWKHAEDILCRSLQYKPTKFYCLLEPCEHCLKTMIDTNARIIAYSQLHKNKWNTYSYIQLTNDILTKQIPISYLYIPNILKVEKFYKKKEETK